MGPMLAGVGQGMRPVVNNMAGFHQIAKALPYPINTVLVFPDMLVLFVH